MMGGLMCTVPGVSMAVSAPHTCRTYSPYHAFCATAAHDVSITFSSCSDALRSGFSWMAADAGTPAAHKPLGQSHGMELALKSRVLAGATARLLHDLPP